MSKHIPDFYRPLYPGGPKGPLRWQDEVSGVLPEAVRTFFGVPSPDPLTPEQLELVREYAEYYINAPCWLTDDNPELWTALRTSIKEAKTKEAMYTWIEQALEVTIDPF